MNLTSDYSITKLFVDKTVTIFIKEDSGKQQQIRMHLKTIRDFYQDKHWNIFYSLISKSDYTKIFELKNPNSSFEFLGKILFLGQYPQYREVYDICTSVIRDLFDKAEIQGTSITINGVSITEEIWDYIVYLLKLSYGEKVVQPPTFDSEEARKLYMAQIANEERIRKIRAQKDGNADTLMKILLSITYMFPSLTIEYLFDQTMAQIQWLQKYAAGAVSYEVNAKAFAAGNVKKGKKLDFFIK